VPEKDSAVNAEDTDAIVAAFTPDTIHLDSLRKASSRG
jgi:ketosteroid isomerase-like protein